MKKIIFSSIFMLMLFERSASQDYFSDISSENSNVLLTVEGKSLFSATLNVGDNSVKANFFRQYQVYKETYTPDKFPKFKNWLGWGMNAKAKTEDGLASIFSSSNFNPGFSGGAYISLSRMYWLDAGHNQEKFRQWAVILSGTFSISEYQFFNSSVPFANQFSDTNFSGQKIGLSFVHLIMTKNSNVLWGASISSKQTNNYQNLTKKNIVTDSIFTSGEGYTRTVQTFNENGNVYATGEYLVYNNFQFRPFFTLMPGVLDNQVSFTFYPSMEWSKQYNPKYNLALAISHLKKGSPSISNASLFFGLDDISDAVNSNKSFFKRSFKFGISTSFNIFTP